MSVTASLPMIAFVLAQAGSSTVFSAASCPYTVRFPAAPILGTPSDDPDARSADLVLAGVRYSALCLTQHSSHAPEVSPATALAKASDLAQGLGLTAPTITPLPALGAGCTKVEGAMSGASAGYQISARICFTAESTFIAEAIYRQGSMHDPQLFLESLSLRSP